MLFSKISVLSILTFAASSLAATCIQNKSCSTLPYSVATSCSKVISSKKAKYTTCTVLKTVVPPKVTSTVTIARPKATVVEDQYVTATLDQISTVTELSTVTEYTTTVFLEEASATLTETEVLSFTDTAHVTETSIRTTYGWALKRRTASAPCSSVPKQCSCFLTKTTTKTVTAPRQTTYTTKTLPQETVTVSSTATASVTVVAFVTTILYETNTAIETGYSTYTITATETTQSSVTATETLTATISLTLYTCLDPTRNFCTGYCRNYQADWYNCGGCGQKCQVNQICRSGICTY